MVNSVKIIEFNKYILFPQLPQKTFLLLKNLTIKFFITSETSKEFNALFMNTLCLLFLTLLPLPLSSQIWLLMTFDPGPSSSVRKGPNFLTTGDPCSGAAVLSTGWQVRRLPLLPYGFLFRTWFTVPFTNTKCENVTRGALHVTVSEPVAVPLQPGPRGGGAGRPESSQFNRGTHTISRIHKAGPVGSFVHAFNYAGRGQVNVCWAKWGGGGGRGSCSDVRRSWDILWEEKTKLKITNAQSFALEGIKLISSFKTNFKNYLLIYFLLSCFVS